MTRIAIGIIAVSTAMALIGAGSFPFIVIGIVILVFVAAWAFMMYELDHAANGDEE